jgi:hypothetical protein
MLENISSLFTGEISLTMTLLFFTTIIVIYSVFIFYFYRFLAKKNLVEFNLNKYNQYNNPKITKIFAFIFYIIEYIIWLPMLTIFWFTFFSVLILVLSKNLNINTILLISAALIAAVRATSYINEDLSRDLAKMLPFTLLAIAITTAGFFDIDNLMAQISIIPSLLSNVPYYILFIIIVEVIMRVISVIYSGLYTANIEAKKTDDLKKK